MAHAVVAGGGPGGLMAAEVLATAGIRVTVLEQMPSVGRKFVLAGRGGLNLTHTEDLDTFLDRYGPARPRLAPAIAAFGPLELRAWCASLGEDPFVGSSGRVFPGGFRAAAILRKWRARLDELGVDIRLRHAWRGWNDEVARAADATVLALGGASWPATGSDGSWVETMTKCGIAVSPLRPTNCGFAVEWSDVFRAKFAGTPLKNVSCSFGGRAARGDAIVTEAGIEGGPVYALSAALRDAIARDGAATLMLDLRPDLAVGQLSARLARRRPKATVASSMRGAGFHPVARGLLGEVTKNRLPAEPDELAMLAKALPLPLVHTQPIDRAISSAGGISFDEVDASYMLRARPGTFVAGEMLDWEAPTGGYLLQATFSTAVAAANGVITWLADGEQAGPGQ